MLWPSDVTATVVACDLPCTSASVILHTSSHSDFTLCFFELSINFGPLSRSVILVCTPWAAAVSSLSVALQSSHCHLVSTSLPAVGTALSSRILGFRPWLLFFVLHVRLIRVLLLTSWLLVHCPSFSRRRLRSGYCFSLQARIADFFFCADSWFRLVRVSRARLFLLA